jgi:RNA polymerase sigma-70 factor (ECF subfamily)
MAKKQPESAARKRLLPQEGPSKDDFIRWLADVGKNQDRAAFIELFEYFAPRIKSFLMKAGTNAETADELAQETMLTIWSKAGSYNPAQAAPATWIFTIARNKRIDALRGAGRAHFVDADDYELEDQTPNAREELSIAEETDILTGAMEKLPADQAELIKKSFFEDKSHADIAAETGLPLGTVKSRIRLALERLRGETKVKALWS